MFVDLLRSQSEVELMVTVFSLIFSTIISLVAAIWVYYDTTRLKQSLSNKFMWIIATFLLWIVFLPIWLLTRPTIDANGEVIESKSSNKVVKGCAFGCLSILLFVLIVLVGVGIFLYHNHSTVSADRMVNTTSISEKKSKVNNKKAKNFDVIETKWYTDSYGAKNFIGKIKNVSGRDLSNIYVTVSCYDKNNNKIMETLDQIDFCRNGEIFDFIAPVWDENVTGAKISNIEVFER